MFDQVKNQVDIVQHIGQVITLRPGGGRALMGKCPFHNEQKGAAFAVYADTASWWCFGACQEGGTVIDFEMKHQGTSAIDAARSLCSQYGIVVNEADVEKYRQVEAVRAEKKSILDMIPEHLGRQMIPNNYLHKERGFSDETIKAFGIGTDASGDTVVVPIKDKYGRIVAFARRNLKYGLPGFRGPKWRNDAEDAIYKKIKILYNLNQARRDIRKEERLILVESYFDVVALWEAGVRTGVAYCSAAVTKEQAQLVRESVETHTSVILAACNDDAAQEKLVRNRVALHGACPGNHLRVIRIPEDCKDLNDVLVVHGAEKLREIATKTESVDTYILGRMLRTEPIQDIQYRKAREIYAMAENVMVQEDMVKALSMSWDKGEEVVRNFLAGRNDTTSVMFKTIPHLTAEYEAYIRTADTKRIKSGWKKLDKLTRGFGRPGDVIQLISNTGVGKTMWAENLILNVGELQPDVPIAFASLEQTGVMAFERFMMMEGRMEGTEVERWFDPKDQAHNTRLLDGITGLNKKLENFVLMDQGGMTLQKLEQAVRQAGFLIFGRPVGLLVIDYLGYLKWDGRTKDQYELVSLIAREQKEMAKRLDLTLVSLHQITKAGKSGGEPVRGYMGRDSGSVQESADIMLGAWRPELAEGITDAEKKHLEGIWRMETLKNRYGPAGVVMDYTFTAKYLRLDELEKPIGDPGLPTTTGSESAKETADASFA